MEPYDKVLEFKKAKFLEVVMGACEARGISPPPQVNFEGETCQDFRDGVCAHVHVEKRLICVSRDYLHIATFEDIQETATHEVSHFFDLGHGSDFAYQHIITKIGEFIPPAGVIVVYPRSKAEETCCDNHQCKQNKELKKCSRCGIDFCDKHLKPLTTIDETADKAGGEGHECSALTEFKQVEDLRKQHLIDIHRFITKVFNVHLNSFIGEYSTRKKSSEDAHAGVRRYGDRHRHYDSLLTPLADRLEYEREEMLKHLRTVDEQTFQQLISFLFGVYERALKAEIRQPEIREQLLISLLILFGYVDSYWNSTYCIQNLKQLESKIEQEQEQKKEPKLKSECFFPICKSSKLLPTHCWQCGQKFCWEHRLPENHNCPFKGGTVQKLESDLKPLYIPPKEPDYKPVTKNTIQEWLGIALRELHWNWLKWSGWIKRHKYPLILLIFIFAAVLYPSETALFIKKIYLIVLGIVNFLLKSVSLFWITLTGNATSSVTEKPVSPTPSIIATPPITPPSSKEKNITIVTPMPTPSLRELEQEIFKAINNERKKKNIPELLWWEKLAPIAGNHSEDMLKNNYLSHINLRGQNVEDRLLKAGLYYYQGVGENINYLEGYTHFKVATVTTQGWMESPGHRENILNPNFRYTAVGVANKGNVFYITQVFIY